MTEMQTQFEEWALSQKWCIDKTGETYKNTYVGCSWQAWQASIASRAEIVVKLPKFYSERDHLSICITSDVEQALNEAGISYE